MHDESRALPRVDLLCYHQTAPKLRIVDPSAGTQRPFGAMKRAGSAIDDAVARDGWIALWAGATYRVGTKDVATVKRFSTGKRFIPAADRRCVWLEHGGGAWIEYDGVRDETRRQIELGHDWLLAAANAGLIVGRRDVGFRLIDPESDRGPLRRFTADEFVGCSGDTVVWAPSAGSLRVDHLDSDRTVEVELPLWRRHSGVLFPTSFAPDIRRLAVTGDAVVGPIPFDIDPEERQRRKRRGSALVIVDLIDGTAELVDGYYENFAYRPVWTADGEWIFFGAPFEEAIFCAPANGVDRRLHRVSGEWRSAPMPLLDFAST